MIEYLGGEVTIMRKIKKMKPSFTITIQGNHFNNKPISFFSVSQSKVEKVIKSLEPEAARYKKKLKPSAVTLDMFFVDC